MSKPTPGGTYIAVAGDTFESIAARAYGDSKYATRIIRANLSEIMSNDPVPGQSYIIPRLSELERTRIDTQSLRIQGKTDDDLTVIIDGLDIPVITAHIFTGIDSVADGFSVQIAWTPGADSELDRRLLPYQYNDAAIYIGTDLIINGVVYGIGPSLSAAGQTKTIDVWTRTADLIDSNLKPPYEQASVTLRDRANEIVRPMGLNVVYNVDSDEYFDRVTAKPTETMFAHLVKLASQRGVLMTCNPAGDVLFTQAGSGQPVGTLSEGDPQVIEWATTYDGRQRFNAYKCIAQSPGNSSRSAVALDAAVPKSRFKTLTVAQTTDGNIQDAANWRRSKQIADALDLAIPVSTWFAPNGERWTKNTLVTVISPTLHVPNGYTFLIRRVEFKYGDDGRQAILHLTPPEAYTGEIIIEPWS